MIQSLQRGWPDSYFATPAQISSSMNRLATMPIDAMNEWKERGSSGLINSLRRRLWTVRIAIGSAALEEQILRLMVHLAARMEHGVRHSLLYHPIFILLEGSAWCDQFAIVFVHLAHHFFGTPARVLHLQHKDSAQGGHYVAEIWYQSRQCNSAAWHLYDPHPDHLVAYRTSPTAPVLSMHELVQNPEPVRKNHSWCDKSAFFAFPPTQLISHEELEPTEDCFKGLYDP